MGLAVTSACGRAPLDDFAGAGGAGDGLAGSGGSAGAVGASGASGRVPTRHRATDEACPVFHRSSGNTGCSYQQPLVGLPGMCNFDGDCGPKPNGRCEVNPRGNCACVFDDCTSDVDCGGGGICGCNPTNIGNACVTGSCRIDSDCGVGGYCGPVVFGCLNKIVSYECHAPTDRCLVDADCPAGEPCLAVSQEGTGWSCRPPVVCY
jgi:hypothetical protein